MPKGDGKGPESLRARCGWNKVLRVTSANVGILDIPGHQLCMGMALARATQQSPPENTDMAPGKARKVVGVAAKVIKFLLVNIMGT